jgi:hypothetical protein
MMNNYGFDDDAYASFMEAALEKYDFASSACKDGEKMTFGKCQKVGGSKKDDEVATVRGKRNLNRLSNQRRRESGRKTKYSKKGFSKHK